MMKKYKKRKVLRKLRYKFSRPLIYFDNSIYAQCKSKKKADFIYRLIRRYGVRIKNIIITHKLFLEAIGYGKLKSIILNKPGIKPSITKIFRPIRDKINQKKLDLHSDIKECRIVLKEIFDKEIRTVLSQDHIAWQTKEVIKRYPHKKHILNDKIAKFANSISSSSEEFNKLIDTILTDMVINNLFKISSDDKIQSMIIREVLLDYALQDLLSRDLMILVSWVREIAKKDTALKIKALREALNGPLTVATRMRIELDIAISTEALRKAESIGPLLEADKDIADAEVMFLAVYGFKKRPVLVLTAEPLEDIEERKKYYYSAIEEIIRNNLGYKNWLAQHPEKTLIGKLIAVDFDKLKSLEITLKKIEAEYIR